MCVQLKRLGVLFCLWEVHTMKDPCRIHSIGWFEGKITGNSHDLHGKIDGFRLRFSLVCQPIDIDHPYIIHILSHYIYIYIQVTCFSAMKAEPSGEPWQMLITYSGKGWEWMERPELCH